MLFALRAFVHHAASTASLAHPGADRETLSDIFETVPEPTRAAGRARLQSFAPLAGTDYAACRNHVDAAGRGAQGSGLSPYLSHHLLTEDEVVGCVRRRHDDAACIRFIEQVCWRTYWKGWLQARPTVWPEFRASVTAETQAMAGDPSRLARYRQALAGRTGIGCFDDWCAELVATGYLHNHVRMWFASIWIFTLRLPWALGADFFLRHLLDGDAASNTLSWRWVGGLHTPGKHYLARAENIRRYTAGRHDPAGQLDEQAPPLPFRPHPLPRRPAPPAPPAERPTALLLTEDDLCPETLLMPGLRPLAVAVLEPAVGRAEAPQTFVDGALRDAAQRAAAHFGVPVEPVRVGELGAWSTRVGVRQLLSAEPPVGATRDTLQDAFDALTADGLSIAFVRRDWDTLLWPHATRGFFSLRRQIPTLLSWLERD